MNVIRLRKIKGAICPKCKSPDYSRIKSDTEKPTFQCNSCKKTWQYGNDGGVYSELEIPS